jgi:signal peptidase I
VTDDDVGAQPSADVPPGEIPPPPATDPPPPATDPPPPATDPPPPATDPPPPATDPPPPATDPPPATMDPLSATMDPLPAIIDPLRPAQTPPAPGTRVRFRPVTHIEDPSATSTPSATPAPAPGGPPRDLGDFSALSAEKFPRSAVAGSPAPPAAPPPRRIGRILFWALFGLAAVALVASIAIVIAVTRVYSVSTPTMDDTVLQGDRVFLAPGSGVRRGDVVVLRVPARASHTSAVFVKRVIGLPGDHVACCDAGGRVTVNGRPLHESYLYPGDRPSRVTFSVTLGPGQIWVMGDRRNISLDSRTWGPVPASGVVGRVVLVDHGLEFTALRTPRTYVAGGLAPADARPDVYLVLALLAAGSAVTLLILGVAGIIGFAIRRRGAPRP